MSSPAKLNFFDEVIDSPLLNDEMKKLFHRHVAQLLYVTKRFRFDCLLAVNVLCSKVQSPTESDDANLDRVYKYLIETQTKFICMKRGGKLNPRLYIDASFGCHPGGLSRTGVVLWMAGACVGAWTSRQNIVTKSSTEAELVGLTDGSGHGIWARNWLIRQGFSPFTLVIYQDNQSVIALTACDGGPSQRTKHIGIKYFYIR